MGKFIIRVVLGFGGRFYFFFYFINSKNSYLWLFLGLNEETAGTTIFSNLVVSIGGFLYETKFCVFKVNFFGFFNIFFKVRVFK